jgi:anti-anti-sigma regulatory factor
MPDLEFAINTSHDGSLVIRPQRVVGPEQAVHLRQTLVHALRHTRPLRLILELGQVADIDPINLGTLAAACGLGDDYHVAVFLDNASITIADQLAAAGVPQQRIRNTTAHDARRAELPGPGHPRGSRVPRADRASRRGI